MRLDRLFLPLAAAALVAACNPESADRASAARAPIPALKAPAAQTAAADCPCAKKDKAKAAAAPRHRAGVQKAVAHPERRSYRRYEALAGGPPHAEYARVPPDYYEDGAATAYRYGPAYPPPGYRDDGWREHRRYEREDAGRGHDRPDGYDDRRVMREPPRDRYGPARPERWEGGSAYSERYSSTEDEVRRVPPPPGYGHGERRAYEDRYEERGERSSAYEFRSASRGVPCCHLEAAGFDPNGFLTWPGKVPARP